MILEYAANGNLRDYLRQRRLSSSLVIIKDSNNHCDSGLEEGILHKPYEIEIDLTSPMFDNYLFNF